jgi:hypothetical protein
MAPISKSDLDQISSVIASSVAQAITQAFASQPKAAIPAQAKTAAYKYGSLIPKGEKADAASLVQRDQSILNGFHRKGFKDVQLLNRADPDAPFNVRPFKGWLDQGRIVRKGQKGVKGLFHITQTDALPSAKPAKAKSKKS